MSDRISDVETTHPSGSQKAFAEAFDTFRLYAFRLELRQDYDVEEERESFRSFLREGPAKTCPGFLVDGLREIAEAKTGDRTCQRVRRVVFPLTDYTRFEILNGYRFCAEVGEQIRILEEPSSISERDIENFKDFWLFDDKICFEMEYDQEGRFVSVRQAEQSKLPIYIAIKSRLWLAAVGLEKSKALRLAWTREV